MSKQSLTVSKKCSLMFFVNSNFEVSRHNIEKLYFVFIRPLFEYACEVWGNCGTGYINKLESLQLEAARIVSGLPIFTSKDILYREVGWETLHEQ